MKVSFAIVLITCMQVSARGYSQGEFSLNYKRVEVSKILNAIQKESSYRFFYNNGYMNQLGKVDIQVSKASLTEVLGILLGNKFNYTITDRNLVIISPVGVDNSMSVADVDIKGKILDENGKPLSGVTIKVQGSTKATTTDEKGEFRLNAPDDAVLEISYVGYKTQTLSAKGQKFLQVFLQPNATGLADVVVVGYGTQRKRDVTGSISSVKGDDIKNVPSSNAATALQGRATGVDIVSADGAPGSIPSIRIRGTGTINNSDPLVVIDGVPASGLNDISSSDIASIEILKDASASAIYGSRAANGVVLITSKKGNFGEQLKTTLNGYTGMNKAVKFIDMLTAPELAPLKQEAWTNDGGSPPDLWSTTQYQTQRTNWQRALIGTGHVKNADLSLRGGNGNSNYSFSGNYYDEKGMIINSYFKRYSFRINSEHKIGSRIRVGENIVYSNTNNASPNTRSTQTGLVWSAIRFNPAVPVKHDDGTWGSAKDEPSGELGDINNPVMTATLTDQYSKTDRVLANAFAELEIVRGLKLRANYGFDHYSNDYYNFSQTPSNQVRGPYSSTLTQSFNKSRSWLEEYFLTYNHLFGDVHNLTLTAGYSAQTYQGNYFDASRSGFTDNSPDQRVLNLGTSSTASNDGYNYNPWGLQSYFIRGNYAFKNRYLLTATMRADGSSKFAPGKRWGYFPAFSGGWRISDEKFYTGKVKEIFNSVKLTGGWGQLGNQNVNDFQYLSTVGLGGGTSYGYNLGTGTTTNNGSYVIGLSNPNITWERAIMTNISAELAALKNHLTATITYFNKNTTDMLVTVNLVETYGARTTPSLPDNGGNVNVPQQNIGKMNNKGVEIELNYQNTAGKLNYSFGINGSFQRNKVTYLLGDSTYLAASQYGRENVDISRTYQGQPIASFYGFKTGGLYQAQTEIDNDPNVANDPNKGLIVPGDVKFLDVNGDGIVNDKDRVRLGDPNPHFVFGFHGAVSYDNFDLNFNFVGALGFKLYNADRLAGLDASEVFNWYADQKNRWHGAGTSNSVPRLSRANVHDNYRSSDLWVQNGSYLSLKTVSLGYTFSNKHISDLKLPDTRIYFSAYNVFMLTKYTGYTPELGYPNPVGASSTNPNKFSGDGNLMRGVDVAQYPAARNFTIGATFNF